MSSLAGGSSNSSAWWSCRVMPGTTPCPWPPLRPYPTTIPPTTCETNRSPSATYFNCDSTTSWSFGSGWTTSTDTALSQGLSCHAGNGQFSTYNNNVIAALTTPVMDLSDALRGSSQTNGIRFTTPEAQLQTMSTIYGKNSFGAWVDVGSITGTIDNDFSDSANWQHSASAIKVTLPR